MDDCDVDCDVAHMIIDDWDATHKLMHEAKHRYGMRLDAYQGWYVCCSHNRLIKYFLITEDKSAVCGGCDYRCLWMRQSILDSYGITLQFQHMGPADVVEIGSRYPAYIMEVLETL